MKGIWSAALTPLDERFVPDAPRAIAYYRDLMNEGCDGVLALGTTGEAMSLSAGLRAGFVEALASGGLPMSRVMAGTGAAALADAVCLTRVSFDCGCACALVMPPFFFRQADHDGIVSFFDALLSATDAPAKSVLLYNFPRMSGIAFDLELTSRLLREFPDEIAGMKDSSNDLVLQAALAARFPGFAVFPGSEGDLLASKSAGAAGCISGSVALWPQLAGDVFTGGDAEKAADLTRRRDALGVVPLIGAMRYLTARRRGDAAWERSAPPLLPLTQKERATLDRAIAPFVSS